MKLSRRDLLISSFWGGVSVLTLPSLATTSALAGAFPKSTSKGLRAIVSPEVSVDFLLGARQSAAEAVTPLISSIDNVRLLTQELRELRKTPVIGLVNDRDYIMVNEVVRAACGRMLVVSHHRYDDTPMGRGQMSSKATSSMSGVQPLSAILAAGKPDASDASEVLLANHFAHRIGWSMATLASGQWSKHHDRPIAPDSTRKLPMGASFMSFIFIA